LLLSGTIAMLVSTCNRRGHGCLGIQMYRWAEYLIEMHQWADYFREIIEVKF